MAYVGDTPWHRSGTYLGEVGTEVTAEQMYNASQLDWTVTKSPAYYFHEPTGEYREIKNQYSMIMDSTGDALENTTVGSKYEPFQNWDMFQFAEALGKEGIMYHTAGSVQGNRKVWLLAQMPGELDIRRQVKNSVTQDKSAPFIMLYNAHDGSSHLTGRRTHVRVVCWNTLMAALREPDMAEFKIRHTKSVMERVDEARQALELTQKVAIDDQELLQELADTPMPRTEFYSFISRILTGAPNVEEAAKQIAEMSPISQKKLSRKTDELEYLFTQGAGNFGQDRFDALQSITQYGDWNFGRVGEWRRREPEVIAKDLNSAQFGHNHNLKEKAKEILLEDLLDTQNQADQPTEASLN
jgi:phage/plasmid-like protein (TIGR03299 family)